jgi:fructokinase
MIVVAGESLVDLVPSDDDRLTPHCGGGPFNTARALARLGQPVSFLGTISDDALGGRLRAQLSEDGVALDAVVATSRPTTLALADVDADGSARYRFYTEGTAAPALRAADALAALPAELEALHVGSLGLMLQPIADAVVAVVESDASRRALVLLDPNIRPSVIGDRGQYLERLQRVLERTDVLKASVEDLAWLEPQFDAQTAARQLLHRGPKLVLVTRGPDGALVVHAHGSVAIPAPKVDVVDTIGAGDAFSAGFLAWWRSRGLDRRHLGDDQAIAEAARFACLVASRTCERAGADPPRNLRPELLEVEREPAGGDVAPGAPQADHA